MVADLAGRLLGYLGEFGTIGTAVALLLLRCSGMTATRRHPRVRAVAFGIALASAVAGLLGCGWRLLSQAQALIDPGEPLSQETVALALSSSWGLRWLWQAGAGVVLVVSTAPLVRGTVWPVAMAGAAAAMTLPLTGHAMEHSWGPAAGVLLQGAHVAASGVWLGTLAVLSAVCVMLLRAEAPRSGALRLAALGARFSPLALLAASVLAVAGALLGVVNVGALEALLSTTYGRLLLVKLALVGGIAGLGAWNWRRVVPALQATGADPASAVRKLAVSVILELCVAVLVLLITALLSMTEAPGL